MAGSFSSFLEKLWLSFIQPLTVVGAVAIFLVLVYFGRQIVRLRRELRRLKVLRGEYREEAALDGDQ
jgi:hypothetical protein